MAKYDVGRISTIQESLVIEADTEAEAIEAAQHVDQLTWDMSAERSEDFEWFADEVVDG